MGGVKPVHCGTISGLFVFEDKSYVVDFQVSRPIRVVRRHGRSDQKHFFPNKMYPPDLMTGQTKLGRTPQLIPFSWDRGAYEARGGQRGGRWGRVGDERGDSFRDLKNTQMPLFSLLVEILIPYSRCSRIDQADIDGCPARVL